jgi:hypothetical protein
MVPIAEVTMGEIEAAYAGRRRQDAEDATNQAKAPDTTPVRIHNQLVLLRGMPQRVERTDGGFVLIVGELFNRTKAYCYSPDSQQRQLAALPIGKGPPWPEVFVAGICRGIGSRQVAEGEFVLAVGEITLEECEVVDKLSRYRIVPASLQEQFSGTVVQFVKGNADGSGFSVSLVSEELKGIVACDLKCGPDVRAILSGTMATWSVRVRGRVVKNSEPRITTQLEDCGLVYAGD